MNIYFDCDGVLADIDKWVEEHNDENKSYSEVIVDNYKEAFRDFDVIDQNIINFIIENTNSFVLTKVPEISKIHSYLSKTDREDLAEEVRETLIENKLVWCEKHKIPRDRVIVVGTSLEKAKYSKPDSILIDDYEYNCLMWTSHGEGLAIRYVR